MKIAKGEFNVKIAPQPLNGPVEDAGLSRMTIEKELWGDLTGVGRGQMLASNIDAQGSGAYVAIERFTGTLGGKTGSFVLVHRGVMTKGMPELQVSIVPDSGTGELSGLTGTFKILIEGKKHSYELEYSLPPTP